MQILIIKGKWNDLTELKHRLTKSYKFKTFIAAAFAIVLTALTFFSIQILEAIFGNGMVEVGNYQSFKILDLFQGENPDAWWMEIEPRTNNLNPAEDEVSNNFQKQGFANILSRLERS